MAGIDWCWLVIAYFSRIGAVVLFQNFGITQGIHKKKISKISELPDIDFSSKEIHLVTNYTSYLFW